MPHGEAISTKWPRCGFAARFVSLLILANASAAIPAVAGEDAVARAGMERVYRMDYAAAEKTFLEGLPPPSPLGAFFAGVACLNRFFDRGDTAALRRAEAHWEALSPRGEPSAAFREADPDRLRLYRGLAGFQLSYAASLRGQRFRSASLALAAYRRLAPLDAPEARAARMLYLYYRDRILEKLPFVGPADFPVPAFTEAAEASPLLREIFLGSLFWIYVDQGRFDAARASAADFLKRYPENRPARAMLAHALFRGGDPAGALAGYEKLREEYAALPGAPERLPLGYYRAVGNLVRVQEALGRDAEAAVLRAEWDRGVRGPSGPWLPAGLKRALARP